MQNTLHGFCTFTHMKSHFTDGTGKIQSSSVMAQHLVLHDNEGKVCCCTSYDLLKFPQQ